MAFQLICHMRSRLIQRHSFRVALVLLGLQRAYDLLGRIRKLDPRSTHEDLVASRGVNAIVRYRTLQGHQYCSALL